MKPLYVNREGVIIRGALEGHVGKVVAFDSKRDEVLLQLDNETSVNVSSEMVLQIED